MTESMKVLGGVSKRPKPPTKTSNSSRRPREYLTSEEIGAVSKAAEKLGRQGFRDYMIIMTAYRHGLRVSEIRKLKWEDTEIKATVSARMTIHRSKNGRTVVHPVEGKELRELRKLRRLYPENVYLFQSEGRTTPISNRAVNDMIARASREAGIEFPVSSHMFRHSRGYLLANKGTPIRSIQQWLGHNSITSTQIYTDIAHDTLKGLGCDS